MDTTVGDDAWKLCFNESKSQYDDAKIRAKYAHALYRLRTARERYRAARNERCIPPTRTATTVRKYTIRGPVTSGGFIEPPKDHVRAGEDPMTRCMTL